MALLPAFVVSALASVDIDEARAMTVRLRPLVEREAGRRFDHLPEVAIATRDEVAARMRAQRRAYARLAGDAADALVAQGAAADAALLERSIAVYSALDDTIYLVKDRLETDLRGTPPERLPPVIRCTLAHELTHALQDRHADVNDRSDAGTLALLEGQATLVARRVCRATESRGDASWFEAYVGMDQLLSVGTDASEVTYRAGLVYAADLGDREAFWSALEQPAPAVDAVLARYRAYVASGWELGLGTSDVVAARLGTATPAQIGSPTLALAAIAGTDSLRDLPRGLAAHRVDVAQPDATTVVLVLATEEPELLDRWVAKRGAFLTHDQGPPSFVARRAPARLGKPPGPDGLLQASVRGKAGYQELWARRGGVVAAVFRAGRALKPDAALDLMDALVSQASAPTERLLAVLDGAPAGEPPPLGPLSWSYVSRPALRAIAEERWGDCVRALDAAAIPAEDEGERARTAWSCAVLGGDRDAADRWLPRVAVRPTDLLLAHVRLHYDAGSKRAALATLALATPASDPERHTVADLVLGLALELGDRAAILAGATTETSPALRYTAGEWLLQHARYAEGVRVLQPVCGKLGGTDAARCREMVEAFR